MQYGSVHELHCAIAAWNIEDRRQKFSFHTHSLFALVHIVMSEEKEVNEVEETHTPIKGVI